MMVPAKRTWLSGCRVWLASMMSVLMLAAALVPAHACHPNAGRSASGLVYAQLGDTSGPPAPDTGPVHVCVQCPCGIAALPVFATMAEAFQAAPLQYHAWEEGPMLQVLPDPSDKPPRT